MSVATAAKIKLLSESKDYAKDVLKELGDLSDIEAFANQILVAIYFRPAKVRGIIRPDTNIQEDAYQSKVGFVIKKGPAAFVDDENRQFMGQNVNIGDFIVYRAADGFPMDIRGVPCRVLVETNIKLRIKDPEIVF